MHTILQESLAGSIKAKELFFEQSAELIIETVELTIRSFQNGGKLILCGNGGSAADAQHLAAEFVNRFLIDRKPLPALALTTDTSILTSVGNDFSYNDIFSKQLEALGKPEDVFLGISTSGNSGNVIQAIKVAQDIGMATVALTGGEGGEIAPMVDILLNVPVKHTPHIQECHIWIEHMLCQLIDERLFGSLQ